MAITPFDIELDEMTLARARRGDLGACESIYRKFNQPAYSVAFRVCQCRETAQEITQEAFITAFGKLRQFRGDAPFWGWLRRVVVNHAITTLRRKPRSEAVEFQEHHANSDDEGVEVIGVSPDGPAERAGLQQGDLLVSVHGVELVAAGHSASVSLREVMSNVEDGEDLAVIVQRDGEPQEFTVTAKRREPRGWQSMIRISDVEPVAGVTVSPHVVVERIEIPEIDEEALAAEVEELTERLKSRQFRHVSSDSEGPHNYEIHIEGFSDVGGHAMDEANIWYGLPHAYGLELTRINAGLGSYFKTDHGVLVIRARDGNAYQLESGDVILDIDSTAVDSPGDMMRVLREVEPGSEIEISIKRKRQDKTLTVEVPQNRLGSR
jgi:RNA polymerase sigma factor (sigma-70 family)